MAQSVNLLPGALIASEVAGVRVLVTAGLVRDLRARAIEAFVSLPRRGVEIGGVLYGHAGADGLRMEAFVEAPCEHRYGPSYALSAADREQLTELIAQPHAEGAALIGFFRSFTSREPLIEAADEEFVRQHFPHGLFVLLMLRPLSAQNCVASFRFFRDGDLLPETDAQPFAFDPAAMQPEVPVKAAPPVPISFPSRPRLEGVTSRPGTTEPTDYSQAEPPVPVLPFPRRSRFEDVPPSPEAGAERPARWSHVEVPAPAGDPLAPSDARSEPPSSRWSRGESRISPDERVAKVTLPSAAPPSHGERPASSEARPESPIPILPSPRWSRVEDSASLEETVVRAPIPPAAHPWRDESPAPPEEMGAEPPIPVLPPPRRSRLEGLTSGPAAPAEPDAAPVASPILPPSRRSRLEAPVSPAEPEASAPNLLPAPAWANAAPEHSRRSRWWLALAVCVFGGILGALAHELWRLGQQPRWVELHLDARPAGDRLAVTWDGTAASLTGATRALLSVRTNEAQREIELTPQQIGAGRYDDAAARGDTSVRLILYAKGLGASGDSVHLVATPAPPPVAPATATVEPPAQPAPDTATTAPRAVREVQPVVPPGIRSRIEREIAIPVEVQVTPRGVVARATAQTASLDGLTKYLAGQAEQAALQWRFTPAKSRRGVPVASAKTLNFVFTPSP